MREIDESRARTGGPLDELVVTMELTLISIIQGVALTFLVESSHGVLVDLEIEFWPYVLCGLLIILLW